MGWPRSDGAPGLRDAQVDAAEPQSEPFGELDAALLDDLGEAGGFSLAGRPPSSPA